MSGGYIHPTTRQVGSSGAEAVVWDDMRIPGLATKLGASAPDIVQFLASGGLRALGFNGAATEEEVYFQVQMPHGYKLGTDLHPHIHWSPTTADAGNVKWQLEYTLALIDGTFGASTTINSIDAASGTAWDHQLGDFGDIDGSGITEVSAMLVCRLFRDPADGSDTYGADAALLEIDFHYEIDTIGSLEEMSKV